MKLAALFVLLLSGQLQAQHLGLKASQIGFSGGNEMKSVSVSGQIQVQCLENGQNSIGHYNCYDLILLPYEYDYFVGPAGLEADVVTLTSTRQDGSTRSKTHGYDSKAGQSAARFNLWIRSLTQTPLLSEGLNSISYVMTKNGTEKARGQFDVHVTRGRSVQCRDTGYYQSPFLSDCNNPGLLCDRYFQERNYCL